MNENQRESFEKSLKQAGKKAHVIQGLIQQVLLFEQFLQQKGDELERATEQDIADYTEALEAERIGSAKIAMRGLGLYFKHLGRSDLANTAFAIREQATAKTRKVFRLRDFRCIDPDTLTRLEEAGITDVEQMLEAGHTMDSRQQLAERTGVSLAAILELVKLADLSRLGGLKSVRARLYYDAGADTPEKIGTWEPAALRQMLADFVERTGFDGIPPLPKEVLHTIEAACKLPKLVQYD